MNLQAAATCVLRFKPPTVVRMNHPQCFLGAATPPPKKNPSTSEDSRQGF